MIADTTRRQRLQARIQTECPRYAGNAYGSHGAIKIIEDMVERGQLDAALLASDEQIIGAIKFRAAERNITEQAKPKRDRSTAQLDRDMHDLFGK